MVNQLADSEQRAEKAEQKVEQATQQVERARTDLRRKLDQLVASSKLSPEDLEGLLG